MVGEVEVEDRWWWLGLFEFFFFLIYFRKLSKKRLKIIFEFNMCTCDKFLLVEYRVEQEKWDSKFGLQFL